MVVLVVAAFICTIVMLLCVDQRRRMLRWVHRQHSTGCGRLCGRETGPPSVPAAATLAQQALRSRHRR